MSMDSGPVTVQGAVKARRARVIYNPGELLVVSRVGAAQRFEVPTPPVKDGYKYKATTADGQIVTWFRQGCSCSYTLGGASHDEVRSWAT